jgi:hypothetical protein
MSEENIQGDLNQEETLNDGQPTEDLSNGEPSTEPQNNSDSTLKELEELRKQNEALRKTMSTKDKKNKTVEEQLQEIREDNERMRRELVFSRRLDSEQIPETTKLKLRDKLSAFKSDEDFNLALELVNDSVNATKTELKTNVNKQINTSPEKSKEIEVADKIASASSIEDLEKLLKDGI